jgi:hypothetical protein
MWTESLRLASKTRHKSQAAFHVQTVRIFIKLLVRWKVGEERLVDLRERATVGSKNLLPLHMYKMREVSSRSGLSKKLVKGVHILDTTRDFVRREVWALLERLGVSVIVYFPTPK